MSEKKQLLINFITNIIYMLINYAITFVLTSFMVSNIGGEAYGFIGLCNNIINYATLVTVALNSVAGRFITIEIHRGNNKRANQYFSSTLVANIILSIILLLIVIPVAIQIDRIFNIPAELINDVRKLFVLTAFNLIISVISTVFTVATFITNKLYLSSIANCCGIISRAVVLLILFSLNKPSIVYVGVSTVISSLLIWLINIVYTKKLCPQIEIKKENVSIKITKELFSAGIWSSVTKLSQILSDGMDLLFSNLWVGAYAMGQLSIAYTLPTFVSQLLSMIINLFSPKLTEHYAKNNKEHIISELSLNMKLTGFFGNVVFFGVLFMGREFFKLWVPTANIDLVYTLSLIACASVLVSSICAPLSNVFLMMNKLKINSLVWLGVGIFDALAVITIVNTTKLGVYAVAGVSKFAAIIIYLFFWPIYVSKCLEIIVSIFYKIILRYFLVSLVMGGMLFIVKSILWHCNGWGDFIIQVIIIGISGLIVNFLIFLDKKEKSYMIKMILRKVIR